MMNVLIGYVFNLINFLTPKKNKIVISSFPDFDDMTRGIVPLISNRVVIILCDAKSQKPSWLPKHIEVY